MKHALRKINVYILIFAFLFIIQKYTLGFIPNIKSIVLFNHFYFYEIFFAFNAAILIKFFVKIN